MYCICCKKDNVKLIDLRDESISEETLIWSETDKASNIESVNKLDGVATTISAGYGSNYDGDKLAIAICDDCIKSSLEDGTILYLGNYIYPTMDITIEDIEKSKRIFRRNKNLDRL